MSNILRNKILETAIKLFNKNGYASVTMRDIAGELNISPGNLTYYFKKKEDIVSSINQMQCDEHNSNNYSEDITVEELNKLFKTMIEHQKKYLFYFYNITELPRMYPEVARTQIRVRNEFYNLYRGIFRNFVKKGIMKEENKAGAYDDLSFAVLSILMFWVQQTSLENDLISEKRNVISVLWNIIIPNFTDEGMNLYNALKILDNLK
jgi:AcrR family transcriptional regulator